MLLSHKMSMVLSTLLVVFSPPCLMADEYGGVGMGFQADTGKSSLGPFVVTQVYPGTPAAKAGIQKGDTLLSVDGRTTLGAPMDETIGRIRGVVGSQVRLSLGRTGHIGTLEFNLTRALLRVNPKPLSTDSSAADTQQTPPLITPEKVRRSCEIVKRDRFTESYRCHSTSVTISRDTDGTLLKLTFQHPNITSPQQLAFLIDRKWTGLVATAMYNHVAVATKSIRWCSDEIIGFNIEHPESSFQPYFNKDFFMKEAQSIIDSGTIASSYPLQPVVIHGYNCFLRVSDSYTDMMFVKIPVSSTK